MQQIAKQLQQVSIKNTTIKVILPDSFVDKVKFLCRQIPKVEWSGVLFYEVKGSIKRPDKLKLICKDILLMDKGSKAYTEYSYDEDVVTHQMENPELLECKIGHIHSHNTMATFFSGTDMSELNDNSPNHNFYFSLIVNNFMDTCAKVSFVGEANVENIKYECKDESGNSYYIPGGKITKEVLFIYDCDVHMRDEKMKVSQSFYDRYREIEIKAEKKAKEAALKFFQQKHLPPVSKGDFFRNKTGKNFIDKAPMFMEDEVVDTFVDDEVSVEELFTCYILRLGNEQPKDDIENAIEDLIISKISIPDFISSLLESYANYYTTFFNNLNMITDNDLVFLQTLEDVVNELEMYEDTYKEVLPQIIQALKHLGNKYEEQLELRTV